MRDQLRNLYEGTPGKFQIPATLFHSIQKGNPEAVKTTGLQANFSEWADINAILVNRPKGLFFWGEEMAIYGYDVSVDVAALDRSKLFAFPSAVAIAANEIAMLLANRERRTAEEITKLKTQSAILAECQAIQIDEFQGQFAAEYIYCGDISADLLQWRE